MHRIARCVTIAILVVASTAAAAPKRRDARAAFDRGVVAYQKGDFAAASEHLGTSFKLEADAETLFAWAQSERQLEHCDRALELFGTLLDLDIPAENKRAVQAKIEECKTFLAAQKPKEPEKQPEKPPEKPDKVAERPAVEPEVRAPRSEPGPPGPEGGSPWWKDPIGDSLVIAGLGGLGVGAYFLISANRAQSDADSNRNYWQFDELEAKAKRDGKIGLIAAGIGGALIIGGVIRYATRSTGETERATLSGWLSPEGGGLAALGRF
jgi:hypothetical protein